MYWLAYRTPVGPCVVLLPAANLIHARLVAAVRQIDRGGEFTEGLHLGKLAKKIPKDMIGRCLSQKQATALLKKLDRS